jgi:hypothetical protein
VLAAVNIGEVLITLWIDDVSFLAALDDLHSERGIADFLWFFAF